MFFQTNNFGEAMREMRFEKSLTMPELSRRVGLAIPFLVNVQNGKAKPQPDFVDKLAESIPLSQCEIDHLNLLSLRAKW